MATVCEIVAGRRKKRLTKEEKGKGKAGKPRKPNNWKPPTIIRPNPGVGVTTRARRTLDFKLQEKEDADADIWDVLQCYQAPESQQTCDSMGTMNMDFSEHVYEEPVWTATTPLTGSRGVGEETIRGGNPRGDVASGYGEWDLQHAGWAVLIRNRFLSEYSFHTGETPSWTMGDVVAEYEDVETKKLMVVCELGGFRDLLHFPATDVRMATGKGVRAQGSEGGHGYGWSKRRLGMGAAAYQVTGHVGQGSGAVAGNAVGGDIEGVG